MGCAACVCVHGGYRGWARPRGKGRWGGNAGGAAGRGGGRKVRGAGLAPRLREERGEGREGVCASVRGAREREGAGSPWRLTGVGRRVGGARQGRGASVSVCERVCAAAVRARAIPTGVRGESRAGIPPREHPYPCPLPAAGCSACLPPHSLTHAHTQQQQRREGGKEKEGEKKKKEGNKKKGNTKRQRGGKTVKERTKTEGKNSPANNCLFITAGVIHTLPINSTVLSSHFQSRGTLSFSEEDNLLISIYLCIYLSQMALKHQASLPAMYP